jgi:hypothetical protein
VALRSIAFAVFPCTLSDVELCYLLMNSASPPVLGSAQVADPVVSSSMFINFSVLSELRRAYIAARGHLSADASLSLRV